MTAQEHVICLLLGSNIQPEKNLVLGVNLLRNHVKIVRFSSVWETTSVGAMGPDFLNLALLAVTTLEAVAFKEQVIRPLEKRLGRVRGADKNAPRTMDIDIILFEGHILDPNLWCFAHRAVPVAEILPGVRSAQGELLKDIASRLAETTEVRLRPDVLLSVPLKHLD